MTPPTIQRAWLPLLICLAVSALPTAAAAACRPGIYRSNQNDFVVLGAPANPSAQGQRYLFRDGQRGLTNAAGSPVTCDSDVATVTAPGQPAQRWPRELTRETDGPFESAATPLAGRLIEPAGAADAKRPLV